MTFIFLIAAYIILFFSSFMRSNITVYFALLIFVMLGSSRTKHEWLTILLIILQMVISVGMIVLKLYGYVQSNYLLFVSAIGVLIVISMSLEMILKRQ